MFKQDKPTISIIVPVYNTSIYLEQCLNSIHNQSFKDYEVICVDDGSSDNSLHILKKYKKIIKNFKVISQKNQGGGCGKKHWFSKCLWRLYCFYR